jgi:hypothetical protein
MFGRDFVVRGGRVRRRTFALTLAAGLVVPGAFVALTPSTAAATGSGPLGPTITQLEAESAALETHLAEQLFKVEFFVADVLGYRNPPNRVYCPL